MAVPEWLRNWRRYLPDVLAAASIYLVLLVLDVAAPPFERVIQLNDSSLTYPYTDPETVPTYLLILLSFVVPVLVIVAVSLAIDRRNNRDLYPALLGFVVAYGLTGLITDIVKVTAGRLRPDFYARCQYSPDLLQCTGDAKVIAEGRKSFPSGHSSFSWAGLGYLSFYLAAKLHLFDRRGKVWKSVIVLTPLVGAYLIAISRVDDYRHHPGDVIAGAILGYVLAYFCYRQYYPALISPQCHVPYAVSEAQGDYEEVPGATGGEPLIAPKNSNNPQSIV